ncbi:TPA: hypothetical protein DCP76_01090 [Patescibacteria group bacterium]|nr:hypothetical protein [Patescibacteria group bacterium]HAM96384.1 hypothetical protein [Patescibacteria group bacterium]
MNVFKRKKTPISNMIDIKKCVGKLALTVKNFNNGPATITVNVKISIETKKYNGIVGNTIPLLNNPMTK